MSFRPLDHEFLRPIDESCIHSGTDVLLVGYPDGRLDQVHNLPLIRKGSIASIPSTDFNGPGHIVIDANVYKGSSGSPVFVAADGVYRLLGVVSETMVINNQLNLSKSARRERHLKRFLVWESW
jgi:Trypsin-like peptidase domain